MNLPLQLLPSNRHGYLILDRNLCIRDTSPGVERFAYTPELLSQGQDVRTPFPELIGAESLLLDILEKQRQNFELKGIARSKAIERFALSEDSTPLYFDLYVNPHHDCDGADAQLLMLLEDATERMVLEQKLAQQTNEAQLLLSYLNTSQKYIDKIITAMADALLVTTASGTIKTINHAAQSLFGYTESELKGQSINQLIPDKETLQKISQLSSSEFCGFLRDIEVICQTKTGESLVVAFSCSAISTEIDGLHNFVYVGRDITERKRADAQMRLALERERELRELKSRFIAMTSHEFRNPLTSILSSLEILENYGQQWDEDKKLKYYQRSKTAVDQMTSLLDDVLLYGKAEAGKLEFHPAPLKLQGFCRDLVEEMQAGVGKEGEIILTYTGEDIHANLDEKLLQHILTNLLNNAVKYSPQAAPVHFRCSCQEQGIIFEVRDEGIGIPPEDQARLFESFHRASNVGKIPGTGLGLAIVHKAVEVHGGQITVESEVGVGTTFRVTLPVCEAGGQGGRGAEGQGSRGEEEYLLPNDE